MGLHSYAGGAFRKYAAKGFGSCANRESNRVPCVHISFFFSFSRPRNFYVRFEYTMCIPLYNTFFDSFRDRGTKREFEKKKRFELDKVKKKKENIFLLLFSIPLP